MQTVLIELRKWLFVGAGSARQPLLMFHSQKQKMEVKGTSRSVGSVSAPSITLHTVMPSKNTAKGRASILKRYTF